MKRHLFFILIILVTSCSKDDSRESDPIIAEDTTFFEDGEMQVIFENDPNGINLIFIGEGYIKEDLGKQFGLISFRCTTSYRLLNEHVSYIRISALF